MSNVSFGELFAAARTSGKTLAPGEFLFRNGEVSTHLYTVLDGCVRMVRYSPEGDAIVMHTARSGDGLAEASLFSDIYHCDAEAVEPSTVACYDKQRIVAILRDSPEKSLACIAFFARQVRGLRTLLEVRSIRSARDRVLHYLVLQADPRTMTVNVSGTLKEMAQDLAMAHETLYRTLAALEKEGRISRSSSAIRILSWNSLSDIRPSCNWKLVEKAAGPGTASGYDEATRRLVDMTKAAALTNRMGEFSTRLAGFREPHARRPALIRRLDARKLR